MKDNMIRILCIEDIPLIITYLKDKRFDCCEFNDFWSTLELQEWLSKEDNLCVGCFRGENLIGFCLTHFFKSINKIYLENIFVDPDYREQGIATCMLNKVIDMYCSQNQGRTLRFVALVETSNAPAISTLKKEGFNVGDKMFWIQKNTTIEI